MKPAFTEGRTYVLGGAQCRCTRALYQSRVTRDGGRLFRYWEYSFTAGYDGRSFSTFSIEEHDPGIYLLDGNPSTPIPAPQPMPGPDAEAVAARAAARRCVKTSADG